MLKYALIAVVLLLGAAVVYVRFAPLDAAKFHIDPETAERPSVRGHFWIAKGKDMEPVIFDMSRVDLAQKVEDLILSTPRTTALSGDLSEDHSSYVTRSGLWGFPDIASVKIIDAGDGKSALLILSRQVFGIEDFGVNEARVRSWLAAL